MASVKITIQDQEDSSIIIDIESENPEFPDFDKLQEGEEAGTTFAQAIGLALYSHACEILEGNEGENNGESEDS